MIWGKNWREAVWDDLDRQWDLVIIGGGITGTGLLIEAARAGARALLVEQGDFGSGTSSRSSKLVHGGLRYLKEGQIGLTRDSVRERERLLRALPGLVEPLTFLFTIWESPKIRAEQLQIRIGLTLFDFLAGRWNHRFVDSAEVGQLAPSLRADGLAGAFAYVDAQTEDARLVLRLLREGVRAGGTALSYAAVTGLLRQDGEVRGVRLADRLTGRTTQVRAAAVVNATGAWADRLRAEAGGEDKLRPLRGSHLIFSLSRLPLDIALTFTHPFDRRPIFIFPWEGVALLGTTDLDHRDGLEEEPRCSPEEVAYLMAAVNAYFPDLNLGLDDILVTFAGVRPVVDTGQADPSREARDHVVWQENGLLTVTGGKLTIFRQIARDALAALGARVPALDDLPPEEIGPPPVPALPAGLPAALRSRLIGRYGPEAPAVVAAARDGELAPIPGTTAIWAELRWAARAEGVIHLEDLLLRRVRLGLLLPEGGAGLRNRIKDICMAELGWDEATWAGEWAAYLDAWRAAYAPPPPEDVPDWRPELVDWQTAREAQAADQTPARSWAVTAAALILLAGLLGWWWRRRAWRK